MPHLEIQLRLTEPKGPDEGDDERPSPPGWILGVKYWDDHQVEMLTAEPVNIQYVAKIARAVKMRGKHEGDLMPWVETLTVRLLDAIEEVIKRHELAIALHRDALSPLAKIHKHADGDKAVRHAEVDQAYALAEKRARQQRQLLEQELRADLEEVPA